MTWKDITQHEEEDDNKHLHLALQSVAIPTLSNGEYLVFKMTEYSSKKEKKEYCLSDSFYMHLNGYKMCFKIYVNGTSPGEGTHLSVSSLLLKGPFDNSLQWPFLGTVSFHMLNQVDNYHHYGIDVVYEDKDNAQPGVSKDIEKFISHSSLSEKKWYLKNDSIYFRVTVTLSDSISWLECDKRVYPMLLGLCKVYVDKEPLVFKLDRYVSMKQDAGNFSSQPFFTSPSGYRMRIKIYPDGTEDGKYLSMSTC